MWSGTKRGRRCVCLGEERHLRETMQPLGKAQCIRAVTSAGCTLREDRLKLGKQSSNAVTSFCRPSADRGNLDRGR